MNGSYGDYYTSKGSGSQEAYNAYYQDYGNSAVWARINADTQSNIANRGTGNFTSTHDSIVSTGIPRLDEEKSNWILLLVLGGLTYKFLLWLL